MSTLRRSVTIAGLATIAVIAGLSQAPAKAQANALQELSRQMIGSNFDGITSPTTLPGSPSLVQSGSESSGRVVVDLVDQEIRRRTTAPRSVGTKKAAKTVQLLVPVRTGLEFAQIEQLVPGAKILEMNGAVFVLASENAQALPVYQQGRLLQAKLGVAFQLAYSDGHPDLNLAWMSAVHADVASAPKPASPQQVAAEKPPEPVKPGTAKDLGLVVLQAPWGHQASQASAAAPSLPPTSRRPAPDSRLLNNMAAIESSATATHAVPKQADTQPPLLAAAASQPVLVAQPQPVAVNAPVAQPPSNRSLRDSLAELRAMRQASAVPEPVASAQTTPPARSASLVKAVAILPHQVSNVVLLSSSFMAVNQELAYVYVKLRDMVEVASLNHVAPVVAVHNRDGQLLARVGVYTNTRVGGRLLNQQMHMLRQQGYEAELVAGSNWSASASKG